MLNKRWVRHISFWVVWILLMTVYNMGPEYGKLFNVLIFYITGLPVFLSYSYLNLYIVIPNNLKSGGIFFLVFYFIVASLAFSVLYRLSIHFFYQKFFSPTEYLQKSFLQLHYIANNMVFVNVPFLMFGSAKMIWNYLLEMNKKNEIESKNIEAELSLLATQLHPHFLFNTLNNLYSLALSGSSKTAVSLQKINGLMKYILYECGQPEITLAKEISLIDDYLELEKLRYDKRLLVSFENRVEDTELLIAPMMLFTFVENCFKHGSSKATGKSYINISLSTTGNNLLFKAENSIPINYNFNETEKSGLGLETVKKRLSFLYPGNHSLSIIKEENRFYVELRISELMSQNRI